jgi:tetratricopeptide (TPR) repeat protein
VYELTEPTAEDTISLDKACRFLSRNVVRESSREGWVSSGTPPILPLQKRFKSQRFQRIGQKEVGGVFRKLLTKARSLFKPSPSPAPEPVEPSQKSTSSRAVTVKTTVPESPVEPSENGTDEIPLRYTEGDFIFTMPLEEEERLVLHEARKKYEEAKLRIRDDSSAWEMNQLKHLKAMQYWCLQIYYRDRAQYFYKRREEEPEALEMAIRYCEKQIAYAPMAIRANQMNPQSKGLPQHYGYKQLAIIYEKQGCFNEAIRLCKQALEEGWKGDWETRIRRLRQKRDKASSNS